MIRTCAIAGCEREATEDHRIPVCSDCGWEIAQRHADRIIAEDRRRHEAGREKRIIRNKRKRGDGEPGLVYYVRFGDYIKIGHSTRLKSRLSQLRLDPATALLAVEPGSPELERERHAQFARDRVSRREDFHPSTVLLEHIDATRAAHEIPQWARLPDTRIVHRK